MTLGLSTFVGPAVARSLLAPGFLAIAGIAAVATLILYAEHPRVSRQVVVSMVPWMVVGPALALLGARTGYPTAIRPAVTGVGAYVTTYLLACLTWFVLLQLARGSRPSGGLPVYLASMGAGVATVVVGTLLVRTGSLSSVNLFWLAIAPIAAAAVAGIVLLLLGLWYTEAAAYTGMVGGLVVFGHALAAIGTAVAVVAHAGQTPLSLAVLNLLTAVGAAGMVGLPRQLLWAWGFVWIRLLLATLAIVLLTAYTRRHPNRGYLLLGFVAAVGVVGGVWSLLVMVVGP